MWESSRGKKKAQEYASPLFLALFIWSSSFHSSQFKYHYELFSDFYRYSGFTLDRTNRIYAVLGVPVKTCKTLIIICFSETFWWWCSSSTGFHNSHQAWKFSVAWLLRVGAWESVAVPTLPYRHFSLLWQCVAGLPGVGYCVAHKHCLLIDAWLLLKMKRLLSSILRLPLPLSSYRENTLEKKIRL